MNTRVIYEQHKDTIARMFADHPEKELILENLKEGNYSVDDLIEWFSEAEYFTVRRILASHDVSSGDYPHIPIRDFGDLGEVTD